MGGLELAPAEHLRVHGLQRRPGQLADEPRAGELLPPRLGLAIPHNQIGVAELAGRPEGQRATIHPAVERERRVAQRAEGHHERPTPEHVVDDLVPHEDLLRVRACLPAGLDGDDRLACREKAVAGRQRHHTGTIDRRNAVTPRATVLELAQRDRVPREVGRPARKGPPGRVVGRRHPPGDPHPLIATRAAASSDRLSRPVIHHSRPGRRPDGSPSSRTALRPRTPAPRAEARPGRGYRDQRWVRASVRRARVGGGRRGPDGQARGSAGPRTDAGGARRPRAPALRPTSDRRGPQRRSRRSCHPPRREP